MTRIASYNVENLFQRAKALNGTTFSEGRPILKAYKEVNELFLEPAYTTDIKRRLGELLVELDIYYINQQGAGQAKDYQDTQMGLAEKEQGRL